MEKGREFYTIFVCLYVYVQMSDDYSIKEYFKDYPNKYEWEVMDKANYGVCDDVVRNCAERLKDASQRGSGQDRDQVMRGIVKEVNQHLKAQNREYAVEQKAAKGKKK